MKKAIWLTLVSAGLLLVGCGQQVETRAEDQKKQGETEKVVIGSVGSDAQIWKFIADLDATREAGLTIEVKEIDSGPQLNTATVDGEVDVNAFQSLGYLLSFNQDSETALVPIATTYMEPMGIYSDKYEALSEVPEEATVAIADNPANTARGLRLLETAGLITLSADFDNGTGTPSDVSDNPRNLSFRLIDDTTGPRILQDVDLALISNTVAFEGGLNVLTDSLYTKYENEHQCLSHDKRQTSRAALQKLAALYHSQAVKEYIEENFGGTKVDVQEEIEPLWQELQ